MSPTTLLLLIPGGIGHSIFWAALVNRAHAFGIERKWINLLTVLCALMLAALPIAVIVTLTNLWPAELAPWITAASWAAWFYVYLCIMLLVVAVCQRVYWLFNPEERGVLLSNHTTCVATATTQTSLLASGIPTLLGKLPGNEVLTLAIQQKQIAVPGWTKPAEPIRIAHITDLHMSGRIQRGYFHRVVDEVNALEPDLIALTGDIVETTPCLDWVQPTLGRLKAPAGAYYVLGNHDRHVSIADLHARLADAGFLHAAGVCRTIMIRDTPVVIGGNEIPWFYPASDFKSGTPQDKSGVPLRILLSHSPDQLKWACAHDVDLVLAGHLHGGQICFPILGAILAPSFYGVRFAKGVFTLGRTVMHVSRGTGSLTPVRYNCPPEITLINLQPRREQ